MSRRPTSPLHSPSSSRQASIVSQNAQQHAPITPSGLRESHTLATSPEETRIIHGASLEYPPSSSEPSPNTYPTHLENDPGAEDEGLDGNTGAQHSGSGAVNETTSLLRKPFEFAVASPHGGPCNHGTFSPRLESRADSVRSGHSGHGFEGFSSRNGRPQSGESSTSMLGSLLENIGVKNGTGNGKKKMSTTSYLAERHGITNTTTMYVRKGSIAALVAPK
jgi:hypothetical protein